ncbi:hypothetical protein ES708_31786 [subsurface metagenome]
MAKKPRILTKEWAHAVHIPDGGLKTEPDPAPWLMQEDIEIIGWSIRVKIYPLHSWNAWGDGYAELSQAPWQGMDGALEGVRVLTLVRSDPITGYGLASGNSCETRTTFLPSGEAITMKEGEYLNLHAQVESAAGEANTCAAGVIVFYRKAT